MSSRARDLDNVESGSPAKHKFLLQYKHSLGRFVLTSADELLVNAVEDSLPTSGDFIEQLEQELDPDNIDRQGIDGGSF
jgi:hypothetical protein